MEADTRNFVEGQKHEMSLLEAVWAAIWNTIELIVKEAWILIKGIIQTAVTVIEGIIAIGLKVAQRFKLFSNRLV